MGETPSEGAARETFEESGYEVSPYAYCRLRPRQRGHPPMSYHVYKLVFLCEILDETPLTNVDTDGSRFFGEHEIPELSVTRVTRAQISRFFEQHRDSILPADFD